MQLYTNLIKNKIIIFLLLLNISYASDIKPISSFKSVGFISDFVINNNTLYVGNDMGTVDIFDIKTKKIINQILLPPLISGKNKIIPADVLSVDFIDNKLLILSVGKDAYRNVWIYENHILKQIINEDKKMTIKEARFINSEQIFFGTLDSDVMLYDIKENYNLYNTHISDSAMGDLSLSMDKKTIVLADEGGAVTLVDVKSSKVNKVYTSQNVDNIFKVAYANEVIITAGQDRRVGVYAKNIKPYYIKTNFLVFCVGISPSGNIAAYSNGEEADLILFNTKTKNKVAKLIGHSGVVNKILFINERELYSSDRTDTLLYWRLD